MISSVASSILLPSNAASFSGGTATSSSELSEEEEKVVQDLKKTDEKVRAHEQAHKNAGGPYASAPTYETVKGPDGQEYAVAGEVKIDVSPVEGNPDATIRKMEIVIRAALAPAEPSPEDRAVAQTARAIRDQAKNDSEEQAGSNETETNDKPSFIETLIKQQTEVDFMNASNSYSESAAYASPNLEEATASILGTLMA